MPERYLNKIVVLFASIAIGLYPYIFWADLFFKIGGGGGSSPYILLVTGCAFLAFAFSAFRFFSTHDYFLALLILFGVASVVLLRSSIYLESMSFAVHRTFIMMLVYLGSLMMLLRDERFKTIMTNIIMFNIFIQAAFGIIHSIYFPHIVTGIELDDSGAGIYILEAGEGGFREAGMLLGSNVYGNFMVLGVILVLSRLKTLSIKGNVIFYGLYVLTMWAIYLSGSRLALAFSLVISAFFLIRRFQVQYLYIPIFLGASVVLFSPLLDKAIERTAEHGTSSRLEKSEIALSMVTESLTSILIGPAASIVEQTRTLDGLPFSDNSFMLLALNYGIPAGYGCLFIILFMIIKNVEPNFKTLVFFGYLMGTLFFNNSILWDMWLFYSIAVLYIVCGRDMTSRA